MTVREMIAELTYCDMDATVFISVGDTDIEINEVDQQTYQNKMLSGRVYLK